MCEWRIKVNKREGRHSLANQLVPGDGAEEGVDHDLDGVGLTPAQARRWVLHEKADEDVTRHGAEVLGYLHVLLEVE